ITHMPVWCGALLAGAATAVLLLTGSFAVIARGLKVLCFALLAYVAVLAVMHVPWGEVLRATVVPSIRSDAAYLRLMLAVFGATLPPYVFFWQSVHRLEEMRAEGDEPD